MSKSEKEQLVAMVRQIIDELDSIAAEQRRQIDLNRTQTLLLKQALATAAAADAAAEQKLQAINSEADFDDLGEKGVCWLLPTAEKWLHSDDAGLAARGTVFLFEAAQRYPAAITPAIAARIAARLQEPAALSAIAAATHGALTDDDLATLCALCDRIANAD